MLVYIHSEHGAAEEVSEAPRTSGLNMLRLLIADGNDRDERGSRKAQTGNTSSEDYARVVSEIDPSATCQLLYPADAGFSLPVGIGLEHIDGLIFTGSTLRISEPAPEVTRQIELMRAAPSKGISVFGSCWGLHLATAACGGDVGPSNPSSEYADHPIRDQSGLRDGGRKEVCLGMTP